MVYRLRVAVSVSRYPRSISMKPRSVLRVAIMAVCAAVWATAAARADDSVKSPAEANRLVNKMSINLADAVRTAERETGGKAACVKVAEWKDVKSNFDQRGDAKLRNLSSDHPVIRVAIATPNSFKEVLIC